MVDIHFQHPTYLALLALVPALGVLWWRGGRSVDRVCEAVFGRTYPGNRLRGGLRLAALALLIVGLAGPAGFARGTLDGAGSPVVFVLDVSASMSAADAEPTRLDRARDAVERIAARLPADPVCLVAVAGDAAVVCPLTGDRGAFLSLLGRASTEWMSGRGSGLAEGLRKAGEVLRRETGGAGAVLLVSDGESHGPPVAPAVRELADGGAVVHTVTAGTAAGDRLRNLPLADGPVHTRARPERTAEWAALGGGSAWRAGPAASLPERRGQVLPRPVAAAAALGRGRGARVAWLLYLAAALLFGFDLLLPHFRRA